MRVKLFRNEILSSGIEKVDPKFQWVDFRCSQMSILIKDTLSLQESIFLNKVNKIFMINYKKNDILTHRGVLFIKIITKIACEALNSSWNLSIHNFNTHIYSCTL